MKGISFLIAVVSAGIGAATTYFVMKKKLDEKDQEIIDIRASYRERVENIEKSRKELDAMNKKKAEMMQDLEKKVEEQQLQNPDGEFIDYSAISRPQKPNKIDISPIKFVTEAEALKYSKEDYELLGLTLYDDDTLTDDETENIISASETKYWIGDDGIDNIRKMYGNNEGIYILNEERKAIYDITVLDERFGDDEYEPITIH